MAIDASSTDVKMQGASAQTTSYDRLSTPANVPNTNTSNHTTPSKATTNGVQDVQTVSLPSRASERFHRVDTLHLKQKLLQAFGSTDSDESPQARQYWQYLGEFLRGRLRREEFVNLVTELLDTSLKLTLHNQLLTAILHNAVSIHPIASTPTLPTTPAPRQAQLPETPRANETVVNPPPEALQNGHKRILDESDLSNLPDLLPKRSRVREWLGGLNRAERDRLKRLGNTSGSNNTGMPQDKIMGEMQRGYQGRGRFRQNGKALRPNVMTSLHPLAQSSGYVPNQRQLRERIEALARLNGMTEGIAEGMDDLLGAALDTHLDGVLCTALNIKLEVKLPEDVQSLDDVEDAQPATTKTNLPDQNSTINLSSTQPHPASPRAAGLSIIKQDPTYELAPTCPVELGVQDLHTMFTMAPLTHPHLGGAVLQLRSGITLREEQLEEEARLFEEKWRSGWVEPIPTDIEYNHDKPSVGEPSQSINGIASTRKPDGQVNAAAGPGPSTTDQAKSAALSAAGVSRLRTYLQPQEPPSLSRPPTPALAHAALPRTQDSAGASSSRSAIEAISTADLGRPALKMQPGPGGILPRPIKLGSRGPQASSRNADRSSGGTGREELRTELEARGLYKPTPITLGLVAGPAATGPVPSVPNGSGKAEAQNQPGNAAAGQPPLAGVHVHGPHHWPYVDPAIILKDILG